MKRILYIISLCFVVVGCRKDDQHLPPMNHDEGALSVALRLNVTGATVADVNLYIFDGADKLCYHNYFTSPQALAAQMVVLKQQTHNVVAVVNYGQSLLPPSSRATLPDVSFAPFVEWAKGIEDSHPDVLTGWTTHQVQPGSNVITLEMYRGSEGIKAASVNFTLSLPSPSLPDYVPSRSVGSYQLRAVAEAYRKGTSTLVLRKVVALSADRTFSMTLGAGSYDFRIWADYVPVGSNVDYYYNTTDTKGITLFDARNYTAGSDSKDALYSTLSLDITEGITAKTLDMIRPFAKYRLVATDVERYNGLVAPNKFPPLEQVAITIYYQGFFPSSFNTTTGAPNNSEVGVKYLGRLKDDGEIGNDYVLVNGSESSVTVMIVVSDKTGKEISRVGDVVINYRRGYLTTVSGDFLTAGRTGGGITINTEWGGNYEVEF